MVADVASVREAIQQIVEAMEIDQLEELLSYLEDIDLYSPASVSRIRSIQAEMARGEVVGQEEFEAKYPL